MTVAQKVFVPSKFVENSLSLQYTSPEVVNSTVRSVFDKVTVINVAAADVSFSAWLVNDGGTADDSNLIIDNISIYSGNTYDCPEIIGHVLSENQTLWTQASDANSLSLRVSGREITS